MNKSIYLSQVVAAIESADDAWTQFYDTLTGQTVALPDPDITGMKDEALAEALESCPGRYIPFPSKYEIHEYRIMESFVDDLPSGSAKSELSGAIVGRGAFRRFKNGIRYHRIEQKWYDYLADAYREIARQWCEENGFTVEREDADKSRI